MYLYLKRVIDAIVSILAIIFFSPLFVLIAILIKCTSNGPVFYFQERVGRNGKVFRILKFRTMFVDSDKSGLLLSRKNDKRITVIGGFLRRTKIDELPQLVNVFIGEMSIVGPRPEVKKYVQLFPKEYKIITQVRPGLTDYASLAYRNENDLLAFVANPEKIYIKKILPHKIAMNMRYVKKISFFVDLVLVIITLISVLCHKEINLHG